MFSFFAPVWSVRWVSLVLFCAASILHPFSMGFCLFMSLSGIVVFCGLRVRCFASVLLGPDLIV